MFSGYIYTCLVKMLTGLQNVPYNAYNVFRKIPTSIQVFS